MKERIAEIRDHVISSSFTPSDILRFDAIYDLFAKKYKGFVSNNPVGIASAIFFIISDGKLSMEKTAVMMKENGFLVTYTTVSKYYHLLLEIKNDLIPETKTMRKNYNKNLYNRNKNIFSFGYIPVHDMPVHDIPFVKVKRRKRRKRDRSETPIKQDEALVFNFENITFRKKSVEEKIGSGEGVLADHPLEKLMYKAERRFDKPYENCLAFNPHNTVFCLVCFDYFTTKKKAISHANRHHPDLLSVN